MSVPKSERKVSRTEFINTAIKIRKDVTFLLLRDFGVKPRVRDFDTFCAQQNMKDEDKEAFRDLLTKYNLGTRLTDVYPEWFLSDEREYIAKLLRDLMANVTTADSIYITNEEEYEKRRSHFNYALANCRQLLQEFQYLMEVLPIDVNKLMPYTEMFKNEIGYLKGVRKSDNSVLRKVLNGNTAKKGVDGKEERDGKQTKAPDGDPAEGNTIVVQK